ncbi:hypothetical protein GYMLUDRAFT_880193 [Collybiopsis luxurians FD-317 M1]|uniref:F-box domain-containing protein n=1 Tax=Collybiopsis luxurians FD-317 M1 TaxID=944289 RepID=A0A0D0BZD3_9AGAR|nr:hypothetical protein GYMLUDRAFT_880193 [Collybiopsis luxurians FD-317 M1]
MATPEEPSRFCPIHCLPVELLAFIFTFASVSPDKIHNNFHLNIPMDTTVISISQTCSYWRKLTLFTESLWAHVSVAIDVVRDDRQMKLLYRWVQLSLRRSKEAPLTILIRDLDTSRSSSFSASAARGKARELILRALFALSDRWFSVTLVGSIRYSCSCYRLLKGFQRLRHLDINSSELYLFQNAVTTVAAFDQLHNPMQPASAVRGILVGNLESLRVRYTATDFPRAIPALSRLRELDFEGQISKLEAVHSLVKNCAPYLERLCCYFNLNSTDQNISCLTFHTPFAIHLPRLKSLEIFWIGGEDLGNRALCSNDSRAVALEMFMTPLVLPAHLYARVAVYSRDAAASAIAPSMR